MKGGGCRREGRRRRGERKKRSTPRKEQKKKEKNSHLSSTCGGRPCAPESVLRRPEGAGRPAIGRKAETEGAAAREEEEAEGARGSSGSGGGGGAFDLTTETRPALAARRKNAAPERMAPFLVFSFRGNRGGGEAGGEAAASGAGSVGDIFWGCFGQKGGQKEKKNDRLENYFAKQKKTELYNSLSLSFLSLSSRFDLVAVIRIEKKVSRSLFLSPSYYYHLLSLSLS